MKRWSAGVLAGFGCLGVARAQDFTPWRPAAPAPAPARTAPFAALPAATPAPGAWAPARFLSLETPKATEVRPAPSAAPVFHPVPASRPTEPAAPRLAVPAPAPVPEPRGVDFAPPPVAPALAEPVASLPAPAPVPAPDFPVLEAPLAPPTVVAEPEAPAVAAQLPKIDVPTLGPPPDPIVPPRRIETAPAPRVAPAGEALPGPRAATGPAPLAPPPTPTDDPLPAKVWGTQAGPGFPAHGGAYPTDEVLTAGATTPASKHGVWGSRELSISRDHTLLDLFAARSVPGGDPLVLGAAGGAADRSFIEAEYLLWWLPKLQIPSLATTGPAGAGFLGQPGTVGLLGPGTFGTSLRDGFRIRAGRWWGDGPQCGLDASLFVLGSKTDRAEFDSSQFPNITRPFFDLRTNREFGERVATPGETTGRLIVENDSSLWGADVNYKWAGCRTCDSYRNWFAGFRFLSLKETLTITELISVVSDVRPEFPVGTFIAVGDKFRTENRFYGGQVGYAAGRRAGRWSFDARGSLALGVTDRELQIDGTQFVSRPGLPPQVFATGGLLAAASNIGSRSDSAFSVVPELTFNLGYALTPNLSATVGYNFLYWTNVARPGEQIDRVIDRTFVPNSGPAAFTGQFRPAADIQGTDIFVQGVQFGLQYRW